MTDYTSGFFFQPRVHLYNIFYQKVMWFKNHFKLPNINDKIKYWIHKQ